MAVTVKAVASTTAGQNTLVVPAGTVAGDLLVITAGSYGAQVAAPAGWTTLLNQGITATYLNWTHTMYKIAVAGDIGATVTLAFSNGAYSDAVLMVISGHKASAPFSNTSFQNVTSGTCTISGYTTSVKGRRFVTGSQMTNDGSVPTFTAPSGSSLLATAVSTTYHRSAAYAFPGDDAAGVQPAATLGSNVAGAFPGHMFTVATGNEIPTVTNLAPSTFADNRTAAVRSTWTYADVEGDPQYRYEIGYRLKDSAGAWTETIVVSANAYHDFATGTFTNSEEYELRLRVDDNVSGWSAYYTTTFTSGTSAWVTSPETKSSGADLGTNVLATHGDFEAANSIALGAWESNPAFGSFIQSTVARTTTKPETGSYSLEVTLPTLTAEQRTVANCYIQNLLVVGKTYRLTARVWMQVGGPDFRADMIYQPDQISPIVTTKGAWVSVTSLFTYTLAGNAFPAVKTEGAATAGQKMYVDNVKLHEVASTLSAQVTVPTPGEYLMQVRTSDQAGFGPWSSSLTVLIGMNVKFKIAGTWVAKTRKSKVGSSWVTMGTKKIKKLGIFS